MKYWTSITALLHHHHHHLSHSRILHSAAAATPQYRSYDNVISRSDHEEGPAALTRLQQPHDIIQSERLIEKREYIADDEREEYAAAAAATPASPGCTSNTVLHMLNPSHDAGLCNLAGGPHDPLPLYYLYMSYLLCRWGDRMWEFAVGLFMIEIWKESLLLTSLYGLVETASIVVFGVILGEWVDRFPRLKVIQTSLALQNVCVFSATLLILILLVRPWPTAGRGFIVFSGLVGVVNVLGGISALASLATKISLERDWVIIMAAEQPPGHLTRMNAVMRRIDLSCTLLAAVFVGLIMSAMSVEASAVIMATWNITCVGLEYWLLLTVYNRTPRLHEGKIPYHLASKVNTKEVNSPCFNEHSEVDTLPCKESSFIIDIKSAQQRFTELYKHGTTLWHKVWTLSVFEGWKIYLRQENMLAGIAFSLLSLSVLRCDF